MQLTATDIAHSLVCVSVSVLGTAVRCLQTVEPTEMPFWGQTRTY